MEEKIIGNKTSFAVQIEIIKEFPVWGRIALWFCNEQQGDYDSKDYLNSTIHTIARIALNYEKFWDDELEGLDDIQIFNTINPFYHNPDDFYDLTYEEQDEYIKYDKYILSWGSGFNSTSPNVVVKDGICTFLWVEHKLGSDGSYLPTSNEDIRVCRVSLKEIQAIFDQLCILLPEECERDIHSLYGNVLPNYRKPKA